MPRDAPKEKRAAKEPEKAAAPPAPAKPVKGAAPAAKPAAKGAKGGAPAEAAPEKPVEKKKEKKSQKERPRSKKKHTKVQIWKLYDKGKRKNEPCPRCGPGTFLAAYKNRKYCGKCGFGEISK